MSKPEMKEMMMNMMHDSMPQQGATMQDNHAQHQSQEDHSQHQ